jgi:glutamate-1-semialdehyde 2,1-aminomutase
MAAGLKTLELISEPGFYEELGAKTEEVVEGLKEKAQAADVPLTANRAGGMFGIFFTDADRVTGFAGSTACDQVRFRAFFHAMLERGVYLAPSAFEAGFVSAAHSAGDIAHTLSAAAEAFAAISV